ncbi:hypothetical protein OHB07_14120 [Streptomyces sp. NBC_00111]|uniref:hypothetical protein n=1 Tax=Streptomyces sp. NBC_00111 TaxID=2975655 RepID=UPI0032548278
MSDDAFECLQDHADRGFHLEMVKGVGVTELAAMVGADPALGIMSLDAFNTAVGRSHDVPDWARLGEHASWAYALRGGGDGFFAMHPEPLRPPWDGRTWQNVQGAMMDPPTAHIVAEGVPDWSCIVDPAPDFPRRP